MARHTIGNKRGSVRGAPPDVYVGFSSFGDEDDPETWEETLDFFKGLLGGLAFIVLVIVACVLWIAFQVPDYTDL